MVARRDDRTKTYHAKTRAEWRAWLETHHSTETGVWLISYKKETGKPRVEYHEAVEEALCFGWVDSRPNSIDDERFMQLYSPRKAGSPWSKLNKERVAALIAKGLMAPAGLARVEAARADGSWGALDAVEELTVPTDLKSALSAVPEAERNFRGFSNSSKKNILWWIASAKRPETRAKRIAETVELAAQNIKANHYRQ